MPVKVAPGGDTGESAHSVTVQVTEQDKGTAAGVTGPLIALTDAEAPAADKGRAASVTLDLKGLQAAGWSDRAALVTLPACALTTPDRPECRTQTPVQAKADGRGTVTAEVTLPPRTAGQQDQGGVVKTSFTTPATPALSAATTGSGGSGGSVVLAAAPSPSGALGNYTASTLTPSSAWTSGSNAGNFTYSYPIQVPPSLGGSAPSVALGYNSADVDGKTSSTNAQPSWVGDGWGYEPGFVERSYKSCDKAGITGSADLCWGGQNAALSLAGHSGTIIRDDATGVWHLESDDGTKVEQVTGAPRTVNGIEYRDEYWRITTPDGIQYYFGSNHLPGGDGSDPATNSALTTAVYSPKSGDPCYKSASGNNSWCQMAWRWQLDYVVDPHGNLTTYKYAAESNKYKRGSVQNGGNGTLTDYQRAGHLTEIAYGQRLDEQKAAKGSANPAAKILFTAAERCIPSGAITCTEAQRTAANATSWPDTPVDQICTDATCVNVAPTFFTTKRLTAITTQVLVNSAYRTVDTWNLTQQLADPGDGTKHLLQLDSVQRVPSNGQAEITNLPPVSFQYKMRANRIDGLVPASPMFMRPRIQNITTEMGGSINVYYTDPECSRVNNHMPASEDNNSMACTPVKWYLPGQSSSTPVNDWFDKPLVKRVVEQDLVSTPNISKTTEYTYGGGAGWHRNDAEFTDPKTRTWDGFRGYQTVTTTTGDGSITEAPKTQQKVTYLRGMAGDYLADGKTLRTVPDVANPLGGTVPDSAQLSGRVVATEIFDQAGGTVTSVSGSTYNGQTVSATHAQAAGAAQIYAWRPDSETTAITKAKLANGTWRTTTAVTTTEPANGNRVVKVDDKGDGTATAPEICTTTGYAASENTLLLTLVSEKTAYQGSCSGTATAANTLSSGRTLFDGRPFGHASPAGDPTGSQVLDHFDQTGNAVYTLAGNATFDTYGRSLTTATSDGSTYNSEGAQLSGASVTPAVSTTALTPATGALPTQVRATGPMGSDWSTTTTLDPARGSAIASSDLNGRVVTAQYDALGRLTAVWAPDRPTNELPSRRFSYTMRGTAGPSSVKTESLNDDAATFTVNVDVYDGLGRTRQSQQTSAAKPTGRLITDTIYDSHGWVIKTSSPYYEKSSFPSESIFVPQGDGQIPGQTWNTYDGNGRVVRAEFRSYSNLQWTTTTAYPGVDRTDRTPPNGATATSTVTDARGRATAFWQYRTATATGNNADADLTTYTYTPSGLPATRTDSGGNTWSSTYDLRGRQVSTSDPDTGVAQTFYDVNSRIDHTVNAKGNTLAYSYDLLGRKTGMFSGSVAPTNQLAAWTYDTLAKGQPTSSTRYVGGNTGAGYTKAVTGYDTAYRPIGTSVTIPSTEKELAGTYTTTNTYSPVLGAVTETDIPAAGGLPAESVTYARTITGLLFGSASLDQAIVTQVDYDALARAVRTTVGDYGTQVVSTQQYDWATGRIINSFLDRQIGTVSTDQTTYTYTPSGKITSVADIQDAAATDTQCFTYDHLGRLTNAWTDTGGTFTTADWTDSSGVVHGTGSSTTVPGIGGCTNSNGPATVSPGGRTVGGPAPYWNTYSYDATGNRTSLVQHDITGNSLNDTTTTQTFGAAKSRNTPTTAPNTGGGTGGPHALLSSTTRGPVGTKAVSYQYDGAGNTTAITDTDGTTVLTWNGEDKLDAVAKTGQSSATTYLYDADGNQLIRRNPDKTTLNLPTDELTLDTASGALSNVRSLAAQGGLTYNRVTSPIGGGSVLIQAADPHGTNGVQIGTDGNQSVTRRPTDPFGNPRGAEPAVGQWAGSKGFVGGSKDDNTGLTNLGARQYIPAIGRFISPDPLIIPGDPQQWNGYAYSNNNPVNFSDPTGLAPCAGGIMDSCGGGGSSCQGPFCNSQSSSGNTCHYVLRNPCGTPEPDGGAAGSAADVGWGFVTGTAKVAEKVENVVNPICWFVDDCKGGANKVKKFAKNNGSNTNSYQFKSGEQSGEELAWGLLGPAGEAGITAKESLAASQAQSALRRFIPCNSFEAGTPVLTADGSPEPIENLKAGDSVLASDPVTGETSPRRVTTVISGTGPKNLVNIAAHDDKYSETGSITATDHHPFWVDNKGRWVDATDLQIGDRLRGEDGESIEIDSITRWTQNETVHNLSVDGIHTYYVLAGTVPVLVHNANCDLRTLLSKLPERVDGGQTSGIAMDSDGAISDIITSGKGSLRGLTDRVNSRLGQWGFRSPTVRASDVEQKVAASMLKPDGSTRIKSVDLVINHRAGPCDEPLGCDMVLPYILNKGQTLTVHYVDGSGVWNSHVYQGLADFG